MKLPSLGELDQGLPMRIYLCAQPADMRRGFDTLAAAVKEFLGQDPFSGNLFLFVGRGKDRLKILYWDKDGFALWYKRLEAGVFKLPRAGEGVRSVEMRASELAMVLDGIDVSKLKRVPRYERGAGGKRINAIHQENKEKIMA